MFKKRENVKEIEEGTPGKAPSLTAPSAPDDDGERDLDDDDALDVLKDDRYSYKQKVAFYAKRAKEGKLDRQDAYNAVVDSNL